MSKSGRTYYRDSNGRFASKGGGSASTSTGKKSKSKGTWGAKPSPSAAREKAAKSATTKAKKGVTPVGAKFDTGKSNKKSDAALVDRMMNPAKVAKRKESATKAVATRKANKTVKKAASVKTAIQDGMMAKGKRISVDGRRPTSPLSGSPKRSMAKKAVMRDKLAKFDTGKSNSRKDAALVDRMMKAKSGTKSTAKALIDSKKSDKTAKYRQKAAELKAAQDKKKGKGKTTKK